ncbi:olfactory receptor 1020-like [Rhinatrema bivittatum]|uniref:olfactory receptor 1020-like n=1 Tax=Rhinatrema bivittatum TaxID=194408 RepID=UPI00112E6860|nr:olfactory receptor 1020-like [Rhinatrema bivittatum]
MAELNQTSVTEFLLLGLTDDPHLKTLLFVVFLIIYLMTLLGNLGIILLIKQDSRLHTPMYFFLSNLSFVDLGCSSTVAPKTLINFLSENKAISYLGCATQMYFFVLFACADIFLLALMAYDRYVAICKPLHYPVVMTRRLCTQLVVCCYTLSIFYSLIQTGTTFHLFFCNSNAINHFFCDIPPMLKISCTETFINEIVTPTFAGFLTVSSVLMILISYISILSTILRMNSAEGRHKAFSTCASHFVSVTLYFGTIFFIYLRPSSSYSSEQNMVVSVFYSMVIPMLNPLIYSLRNQEVIAAVKKITYKNIISHKINSIVLIH